VELAVQGDLAPIAPSAELAVYRIVQESLTNILKHARNVEHVWVEVLRRGERVELRVRDDGATQGDGAAGTPPGAARLGHGLSGMQERARLFGGEVSAGPCARSGWEVQAWLGLDHSVPA
jgi:signal transduction histidine kinase